MTLRYCSGDCCAFNSVSWFTRLTWICMPFFKRNVESSDMKMFFQGQYSSDFGAQFWSYPVDMTSTCQAGRSFYSLHSLLWFSGDQGEAGLIIATVDPADIRGLVTTLFVSVRRLSSYFRRGPLQPPNGDEGYASNRGRASP